MTNQAIGLNNYATGENSRYPELWRGCVGAWAMCLGPTGSRLFDFSGRQNWGTLTNMDAATDWVVSGGQYALDFDGTNDFVTTADSTFDFTDKFSVALWCNIRSGRGLLSKGDLGGSGYGFDFGGFTAGQIEFFVAASPTVYLNRGFANPGGWTHVVGMFDSSISGTGRSMLFINGTQQTGTVTNAGLVNAVATNNFNLIFAAISTFATQYNGQLDDIRAYNRILSPTEIRLLASRRGIAYERRRRRRVNEQAAAAALNAIYATRQTQLIGGGLL